MIFATCLSACCSHSDDTPEPTPQPSPGPTVETGTPISFYGQETEAQDVSQGVKGTRAETRAGTPLSEAGVLSFTVWGYKNMTYDSGTGSYDTDPNKMQEVFPGYTVNWQANSAATTTTNTNGWEYILLAKPEQTIKYWDWSAKAYRFFAVTGTKWESGDFTAGQYKVNANVVSGPYQITLNADAEPVLDGNGHYDPAATATKLNATPYFTRLWFSTGNIGAYPDKQFGLPVQLEFLKPYARVRFIFKYAYPREGIKLTKTIFKPTDDSEIYRKGTFTVSYPMTGAATSESYTVTPEAVTTTYTAVANGTTLTSGKTYYTSGSGAGEFVSNGSEVADGSNYFTLTNKKLTAFTEDYDLEDDGKDYTETDKGWYMVLPNTTPVSYTLSVKVNTETKTCSVPAEYMRWLPGYSYTYIFKILEEGGVEIELVQAAVTPWVDMAIDYVVYNW